MKEEKEVLGVLNLKYHFFLLSTLPYRGDVVMSTLSPPIGCKKEVRSG